jgi:uncharacterized metal-binding protein YceD (DUF177 family)
MSRWPEKPVSLAVVAAEASRFSGELGAGDMPRIRALVEAEALDAAGGSPSLDDIRLSAECTFRQFEDPAFVALEGSLRGVVPLLCQRCLEPLSHAIEMPFALALCKGDPPEDWLGSLADRFERWDVDGDEFDLTECLDEFLALGLPLAAAHADIRDCGPLAERIATRAADEPPVHRPFAALAALMEDKP